MKKNYFKKMNLLNVLRTGHFLILLALMASMDVLSQSFSDNTPGTGKSITLPAEVTSVRVRVWGAGGAGGGSTIDSNGGSGGGGGGYTEKTFNALAGDVITYDVGSPGTASVGGNGTSGTQSRVNHSSFTSPILAGGGTGGFANSGAVGTGGVASNGDVNTNGSNGILGNTTGGNGGNAGGVGGGTGGLGIQNGNGSIGNPPGGGGGGGEQNGIIGTSGGDGASGRFEIYYTFCGNPPTALLASSIGSNSATILWTNPTPLSASGTQYYYNTTGIAPIATTTPTGSVASGVSSVNLTGLTTETLYYFWVRSNCGANQSGWIALPTFKTNPCAGNPTGITINSITGTSAVLNWTAAVPAPAAGYEYYYSTSNTPPGAAPTPLYAVGPGVTTANITGLTANTIYYLWVRSVCDASNKKTWIGSFVFSTGCAGDPVNIYTNVQSQTSALIGWTAGNPVPSNGYDYYYSTSNVPPGTASGTTMSTSVTVTGLTAGAVYYIWVRSKCTSTDLNWIGPLQLNLPTCSTFGTGTGTSTFGCANVLAGELGSVTLADPAPMACATGITSVNLEAKYLPLGETTSYTVSSIPYAPPYQFGCLKNPISVNTDDVWSPVINLPFNFCFYGNNYNKCLIGSNGVITFDTVTNIPGGSCLWYMNSVNGNNGDLPQSANTTLIKNAIFGVFHDIDPNAPGVKSIGWELITLNSGCRALVASWENVPMYSTACNSSLYTGMIVLYENTNVIEVYVREKNVCATWNEGNAVIGIQNDTGTIATVPPNRNVLDPDWTTTNEAWRFTPSGASLTTINWYLGSTATGTPIATSTNVINVNPAVTTTYTAAVTYTFCNGQTQTEIDNTTVTINGSNKIWNGSVDTDWDKANNWTPVGVPTNLDCVDIQDVSNDAIISGTSYNGVCYNLKVRDNALLDVFSTNNLVVTDKITVEPNGLFRLNNSSNLVQINNVTNTGNIQHLRNVNIRRDDYVYWSSPVASFPLGSISAGTSSNYLYKWLPSTTRSYASNFGNWSNTTENMVLGKGYIVRGPNAFSATVPATFTSAIIGTPNNGNIISAISRDTYNGANYTYVNGTGSTVTVTADDDNWNLIGNPYPSSLNADKFLTANTNIAGYVKLWSHGTLPSNMQADPFYADFGYNYTPADYHTYNLGGTNAGPGVFNGNIASGQGFFVLMNNSASTPGNVSFDNSMRRNVSSLAYDNSNFFRNGSANNAVYEKNRIWLDIINASNKLNVRTLIGYMDGATNQSDRLYDANTDEKMSFNIYSLLNNEMLTIQGKALPFSDQDRVSIGITVPQTGDYQIGIGAVDGLFANSLQAILLEDKLLNVTHNLRSKPYSFKADKGKVDNRFVLKYIDKSSSKENSANDIKVYVADQVVVKSSTEKIKEISVYNVLGKRIINYENIYANEFLLDGLKPVSDVFLVKVVLANGETTTRKIIY